jgi:hypothetical protein
MHASRKSDMPEPRRMTRLLPVLLALFVAGCASAPPEGGAASAAVPPDGLSLRIHNTDSSGQQLTVYLVPNAGEHIRLGSVAPNDYLTIRHPQGEGRFQLRGMRPDGSSITSPEFQVNNAYRTYSWDIALRRVDRVR